MFRILLAAPLAWLTGLAAYVAALWLFWGQTMGGGDALAVMVWSFIALLVAVLLVYWPAFILLRRLNNGYQPPALFALVAAALGIVPAGMIHFYWGGGIAGLLSPGAKLFYCMFAAAGVVLGLAYSLRREPSAE